MRSLLFSDYTMSDKIISDKEKPGGGIPCRAINNKEERQHREQRSTYAIDAIMAAVNSVCFSHAHVKHGKNVK